MGGAGGAIATRMVAKAEPDGYTFLFPGPGHASLPFVTKNPGYDVRADFASVSLVTRFPLVIVTNPNLPARNTAEFIAHGQGGARKVQLRVERHRRRVAHSAGSVQVPGRHRHDPRAVPRQLADDGRRCWAARST